MNIIGRTDKIDFPEFELINFPVKIDTGAYTSSIHCEDFIVEKENGEKILKFSLKNTQTHQLIELKTKSFKRKNVKSSNGIAQKRYIISTKVKIFSKVYKIELSLSDRNEMKYPSLIGRKFLTNKFIVDTSKKNLSYAKKIKTK